MEDFQSKRRFGSILNCKVQLGSYLLKSDGQIEISDEKSELFLKYLEDCCDCTEHGSPGISCRENSTTASSQNLASNSISAFIKQSALPLSVRDI